MPALPAIDNHRIHPPNRNQSPEEAAEMENERSAVANSRNTKLSIPGSLKKEKQNKTSGKDHEKTMGSPAVTVYFTITSKTSPNELCSFLAPNQFTVFQSVHTHCFPKARKCLLQRQASVQTPLLSSALPFEGSGLTSFVGVLGM